MSCAPVVRAELSFLASKTWAPEKRSKVFSQNLPVTLQRLGKSRHFCSGFTTLMTRPQSNFAMLFVL